MVTIKNLYCCAVMEINGISYGTAKETLEDILRPRRALRSIILFTTASPFENPVGYGENLKALIEEHGLGTVTQSEPARNKNTNNYVTIYTWVVNPAGVTKWRKGHK